MTALDLSRFDALTFDCYGTLIDWERGQLAAMRPVLDRLGVEASDTELIERYTEVEAELEAGPYLPYREVLAEVVRRIGRTYGVEVSEEDARAFGGSVVDWPAFPDSADALARLATRYRLAVITNCDDDLFAASEAKLGVTFEPRVTAQQLGSYKPDPANFKAMFERLAALGIARDRVLHVAQSLYHDHVPALRLGLPSVWIDRRGDRHTPGWAAPPGASPALVFDDMASFAAAAVGA